jgi:hypothetical protein
LQNTAASSKNPSVSLPTHAAEQTADSSLPKAVFNDSRILTHLTFRPPGASRATTPFAGKILENQQSSVLSHGLLFACPPPFTISIAVLCPKFSGEKSRLYSRRPDARKHTLLCNPFWPLIRSSILNILAGSLAFLIDYFGQNKRVVYDLHTCRESAVYGYFGAE